MTNKLSKSWLILLFASSAILMFYEMLSVRTTRIIFNFDFYAMVLSLAILGIGYGNSLSQSLLKKWPEKCPYGLSLSALTFMLLVFSLIMLGFNVYPGDLRESDTFVLVFFFCNFLLFLLYGIIIGIAYISNQSSSILLYSTIAIGNCVGVVAYCLLLNQFSRSNSFLIFSVATILAVLLLWYRFDFKSFKRLKTFFLLLVSVFLFLPVLFVSSSEPKFLCHHLLGEANTASKFHVSSNYFSEFYFRQMEGPDKANKDAFGLQIGSIDCVGVTTGYDGYESGRILASNRGLSLVPMQFAEGKVAAILSAGLGKDISRAIAKGAEKVYGVEINPAIIAASKAHSQKSIYKHPKVVVINDENRSALAKIGEKLDLIHIHGGKSYGGINLTKLWMNPGTPYTHQAFDTYLNSLSAGGYLWISDMKIFSRNYLLSFIDYLKFNNLPIDQNLRIVTSGKMIGFLYKKLPLSRKDLRALRSYEVSGQYMVRPWRKYKKSLSGSVRLTDNKPFFELKNWGKSESNDGFANESISTLFKKPKINYNGFLLARNYFFVVVVFVFLQLSYWIARRRKYSRVDTKSGAYYFLIGFGFIGFQMIAINGLTPALNRYTLIVVVLSNLLGLCMGNAVLLKNKGLATRKTLYGSLILFSALTLLLAFSINPFNALLFEFSDFTKCIVAGGVLFALSCLQGVAFPLKTLFVDEHQTKNLGLFISFNSFACALGSIFFHWIVFYQNLSFALSVVAICYLISAILVLREDLEPRLG